jgi:hypothetical protein
MQITVYFGAAVNSTLFLLLVPFRLWKLRRATVKTVPESRGYVKWVRDNEEPPWHSRLCGNS